ncbi:hypothetical protein VTN96DRAFT_10010 [Rasamsonia emersonii]
MTPGEGLELGCDKPGPGGGIRAHRWFAAIAMDGVLKRQLQVGTNPGSASCEARLRDSTPEYCLASAKKNPGQSDDAMTGFEVCARDTASFTRLETRLDAFPARKSAGLAALGVSGIFYAYR